MNPAFLKLVIHTSAACHPLTVDSLSLSDICILCLFYKMKIIKTSALYKVLMRTKWDYIGKRLISSIKLSASINFLPFVYFLNNMFVVLIGKSPEVNDKGVSTYPRCCFGHFNFDVILEAMLERLSLGGSLCAFWFALQPLATFTSVWPEVLQVLARALATVD